MHFLFTENLKNEKHNDEIAEKIVHTCMMPAGAAGGDWIGLKVEADRIDIF